jgi:hypothetical protein
MQKDYKFPKFPNPLTRPMATERFAGGRGIALATQTNVNVKPARQFMPV